MRSYRDRQKDTLRGERAQELREREFNARFTQLEELEMASEADGVSKRTEEYNGQKIPVYDLSGYPFRFLQHSVGFKDVPGQHQGAIGLNMARRLLNAPALWMRREPEITRDTAPSEQEANTVSASYVDTEINLAQGGVRDPYGVAYGFLSIRPDSCIGLFAGDSGTSNSAGHSRAEAIHLSRSPDALAEISTVFYNEVLLRRYDGNGHPTPPDCLIVHNGVITDNTRYHAAYFNVPIININDQPYLDKQKEKLVAQIESLDDKSEYDEIYQTLRALAQSPIGMPSPWKTDIYDEKHKNSIEFTLKHASGLPEETRTKLQELIEDIEPAKRLEMLEDELTRVTSCLADVGEHEKYKVENPFHIQRMSRWSRLNPGSVFEDAIGIDYFYRPEHRITTLLQTSDPAYERFSSLADKYAASGGHVFDRRVKRA